MNLSNVIVLDTYANRPAASIAGRLFFSSDTLKVYRDSGSAWVDATPAAALSADILRGLDADKPAAATVGRLYCASDTLHIFRDNGATWDDVTPTGAVSSTRTISTTAPLTGGGDLSANRTLAISDFTGDAGSGGAKGAVPAPAAGDAAANKVLGAGGAWVAPAAGGMTPVRASSAPSSPAYGQIWLDSSDAADDVRKIWQHSGGTDQWIAF